MSENAPSASISRVALVTGGGQGLGRATAEMLRRNGMTVVLADIDGTLAERTAVELTATRDANGATVTSIPLDVADEASVLRAFAKIGEQHGRLDVLINSAGVLGLIDGKRPLVEDMTLAAWRRTLDVNLTGTFLCCRAAIPLMKRHQWGRIVNLTSRAARMRTGPGNAHYAASKIGIVGFSRVLAGEVGPSGITVNCIAPSGVLTAMTSAVAHAKEYLERSIAQTPVGRLATPEDVANAIAFVCSDAASFITGSVIDVNGGSFMA